MLEEYKEERLPGQISTKQERTHASAVLLGGLVGAVALVAGAEGVSNLVTGHDIGKSNKAPAEHVIPGAHNTQPGTGALHTKGGNFHVTQK